MLRYVFWGFFFGTAGLYALAGLSLVSPIFETITTPFIFPGRFVSELIAGSNGNTIEVTLLTFLNGVFYALVFMALGTLFGRPRPS